jgi:hypothetical protein
LPQSYEYRSEDIAKPGFMDSLNEAGFGVIRGFFTEADLKPLWADVRNLAIAFASSNGVGLDEVSDNEVDRLLVSFLKERPQLQGVLYDRLQQTPANLATPGHEKFRDMARKLFNTEAYGIWPRMQVRLDLYQDKKNVIEWHHDYLYNQGTKNSWTAWMPLVDISEGMGLLRIAPGTHSVPTPFEFTKTGGVNRFDYTLDPEVVAGLNLVRPDFYNAGDLVLFHSLVIHAGAENQTLDRARLVQLFRLQNLNDLEAFETTQ